MADYGNHLVNINTTLRSIVNELRLLRQAVAATKESTTQRSMDAAQKVVDDLRRKEQAELNRLADGSDSVPF